MLVSGDLDEILVSVGDKDREGQALVKYSSSEAQAAYDSASRAVAKADRHINELNQARNEAASAPAPQLPAPVGGEDATVQSPTQWLEILLLLLTLNWVMPVMRVQMLRRN